MTATTRTEGDDVAGRQEPLSLLAWVASLGLVFVAAPLLRAQVAISDELDLGSIIMPFWTLGQLGALIGALTLLDRIPAMGRGGTKARWWVGAAAFGFGLLFVPTTLSLMSRLWDDNAIPLDRDPVQVALLWSTPLLFYVAPAAIVAMAWIRSRPGWRMRGLGLALCVLGALNLVAILWFARLWFNYSGV